METLTRTELVDLAREIAEDFKKQGYDMTLRQVYYQCVKAAKIPNSDESYKRLGNTLGEARLAGNFDMDLIVDRGRDAKPSKHHECKLDVDVALGEAGQYLRALPHWSIAIDRWFGQPKYVSVWCFPPQTGILSSDGVVPICTLEEGDMVLTREGDFKPVTATMTRPYKGDMVRVITTGLPPIEATTEHPFLVKKWDSSCPAYTGLRRKFSEPTYVDAHALHQHDLVMVPRLKTVDIGSATGQRILRGGPRSRPVTLELDAETYFVCGLYLAEGSVREDGRTLQFCFGAHEQNFADAVVKWAASLGVNTTTTPGAGTLIVYVFSKALVGWFKDAFGCGSWHKTLPQWMLTAPQDLQSELLRGYFLGDGSKPDENHPGLRFNTRSEGLARLVHLMCLRLGYAATLGAVTDHGDPMWRVGVSGLDGKRLAMKWGIPYPERAGKFNRIYLDEDYAYFSIRKVERTHYEGTVHNIEVQDSHTYCVPVVTHNCEKEALAGICEKPCADLGVGFFACKGYPSHSALWQWLKSLEEAYQTSQEPVEDDEGNELDVEPMQEAVVLYFGDHDPDGWQIPRSALETLRTLASVHNLDIPPIRFIRVALLMSQIKQYQPPPFPAKTTSSRYAGYYKEHGIKDAWELDALSPKVLDALIRTNVAQHWDQSIDDHWQGLAKTNRVLLRQKMKEPGWVPTVLGT